MDHQPPPSLPMRLASAPLTPLGKAITVLLSSMVFGYTWFAYDQMYVEYRSSSSSSPNYNANRLRHSNTANLASSHYRRDNNKIDNHSEVNTSPANNRETNSAPLRQTQQSVNPIQQQQAKKQREQHLPQLQVAKDNCQIIYILGVEGAIHHGFTPILETLAKTQRDPKTGRAFEVTYAPKVLRSALFGLYREKRGMDEPTLIAKVFHELCPESDGETKHVIIEDSSFPSGAIDDPRSYRVHRQASWMTSTMEQVAKDELALNHPTNLYKFYELYSQYADVQFILLNRPFIETMASHANDWGEEVVGRGFMLILKQFLAHIRQKEKEEVSNRSDMRGKVNRKKKALSTIVCADKIMSKSYKTMYGTNKARQHVLEYLTEFLGWPTSRCPQCFSTWEESRKDPAKVLGANNLSLMLNDRKKLEGLWPPLDVIGSELPEQQCSL